jgi:class 3 adenylate cyclase
MPNLKDVSAPMECNLLVAFIDITGFAKEFDIKTDRQIFDLVCEFYKVVEQEVETSGGETVKFMGDAALIVYPEDRAKQGVEALRHLKATIDRWLIDHRFGGELLVRAHIGPVIWGPMETRKEPRLDVFGKTVIIAAKLPSKGWSLSQELERHVAE